MSWLSSTSRIRTGRRGVAAVGSVAGDNGGSAGRAGAGTETVGISSVKCGALPRAGAGGGKAAAVLFDDRPAEGQTQPQAAELARRCWSPPVPGCRKSAAGPPARCRCRCRSPRSRAATAIRAVTTRLAIARTHRHLAPGGGELDGVFDQIPEACCNRIGSASTWWRMAVRSRTSWSRAR